MDSEGTWCSTKMIVRDFLSRKEFEKTNCVCCGNPIFPKEQSIVFLTNWKPDKSLCYGCINKHDIDYDKLIEKLKRF